MQAFPHGNFPGARHPSRWLIAGCDCRVPGTHASRCPKCQAPVAGENSGSVPSQFTLCKHFHLAASQVPGTCGGSRSPGARHSWRVKTQGLSRVNSRYASISRGLLPGARHPSRLLIAGCQAPVPASAQSVRHPWRVKTQGLKLRVCPGSIHAMQAFPGGCFQVPGTGSDSRLLGARHPCQQAAKVPGTRGG
jgi:hypothetical protein